MSRAIDADALIHELNNSHYPGAPYVDAGISIAIGKVCDAPTIEPERKKGKWITDKYGNVLCSECNWCAPQTMTGCLANRHLDYEKSAFCWHCGADMREPEDIPMEYFESGGR